MSRWRLAIVALTVILVIANTAGAAGAASGATAKTSYLDVVDDVMCVVCHEALNVAQSPEAFQEREYIRQEIAQGKTRKQIENDLVQQYGPAVLARPPANGVNVLVYIVPPVVVILGIVIIAIFIPRWRRRAREADASAPEAGATLDAADAKRLNEDLGRFA